MSKGNDGVPHWSNVLWSPSCHFLSLFGVVSFVWLLRNDPVSINFLTHLNMSSLDGKFLKLYFTWILPAPFCTILTQTIKWHKHSTNIPWLLWVVKSKYTQWSDTGMYIPVYSKGCPLQRHRPYPNSKVHVASMGPTWVLSARGGTHVGPMNLAIRVGCGSLNAHASLADRSLYCVLWVGFQVQWDPGQPIILDWRHELWLSCPCDVM